MRKCFLFCFVCFFVIVGVLFFSLKFSFGEKTNKVCFDSVCFEVDVAKTSIEKMKGLMGIEYLAEEDGMLFVYEDEGNYSFWMKKTLIPLDILWIDEDYEVVNIENVFPCVDEECEVYNSLKVAKYVLEINYGLCLKYGIDVGDKVRID